MVWFSSDQTVSTGGTILGLGTQGNSFDASSLPVSPIPGKFTSLTFSIKQNIKAGVPVTPGINEYVDLYLVIVPYNNNIMFPNTYGIPDVDLNSLDDFLTNQGPIPISGVLIAPDSTYVPMGTSLSLNARLTTGNQCVFTTYGQPTVNACDIFAVWIKPNDFSSFLPAACLGFEF